MTTEYIFEWSALVTSPFIANVVLYFALPTVSQRFPTTHQVIGWVALSVGVVYLIAPFTFNRWFASVNVILTATIFWYVWKKSLKKIQQQGGTIPVIFFKNPPKYGKNLLSA